MKCVPSVVMRSHQKEYHDSPASMVGFRNQRRSGFPQQTQTAKVGLQADLIRVLEVLPQTAIVAHTGRLCIQGNSPNGQIHDLGRDPKTVVTNV